MDAPVAGCHRGLPPPCLACTHMGPGGLLAHRALWPAHGTGKHSSQLVAHTVRAAGRGGGERRVGSPMQWLPEPEGDPGPAFCLPRKTLLHGPAPHSPLGHSMASLTCHMQPPLPVVLFVWSHWAETTVAAVAVPTPPQSEGGQGGPDEGHRECSTTWCLLMLCPATGHMPVHARLSSHQEATTSGREMPATKEAAVSPHPGVLIELVVLTLQWALQLVLQ
ncbi:UNVERIFIED_CONTAM: hypothetical protein K2H54_035326 [Gekko kuhli]